MKFEKFVILYNAHFILLYLAPSAKDENPFRFISQLGYQLISSCVQLQECVYRLFLTGAEVTAVCNQRQ